MSEGVVVCCFVAKKTGFDEQDLVVEVQLLDLHLEVESLLMFHGNGKGWFPISKSISATVKYEADASIIFDRSWMSVTSFSF